MGRKAKNFLIIFLGICGFAQYSRAQVDISTAEKTSIAVEEEVLSRNAIDEMTTGSETALEPQRDPFWPVGYWPEEAEIAVVEDGTIVEPEVKDDAPVDFSGLSPAEQALIKDRMRIGGILSQPSGCIAIINDQLLKEGDTLQIEADKRTFEFLLKTLTTERVLLESLSK